MSISFYITESKQSRGGRVHVLNKASSAAKTSAQVPHFRLSFRVPLHHLVL